MRRHARLMARLTVCVIAGMLPLTQLPGGALAQKQPAKPAEKTAPEKPAEPVDEAYAAYQRGNFLTAFNQATERAKTGDAAAMTLLGEIYANGQGVVRDDTKAAEWYRLAGERGDRQALYALGTFRLEGRAGPRNRDEAMDLFIRAAKLGNASAAYNVGLANLEPQGDLKLAVEYLTIGVKAGLPDAQYALAVMYKEGHGVPKNGKEAMRLMQQAAIADHPDAMVEFAIAQFNGIDTPRDETAAIALLKRAALLGSPIAQNRLAHVYRMGRGIAADPVQAMKWHLAARAGGANDPTMEEYMAQQTPQARAEAERAAAAWVDYYKEPRLTPSPGAAAARAAARPDGTAR